jgi:hypothetical protein
VATRFAAHWTSPHGGVRVFLGTGDSAADARRRGQHELLRQGFGHAPAGRIDVVPAAWSIRPTPRLDRPRAA